MQRVFSLVRLRREGRNCRSLSSLSTNKRVTVTALKGKFERNEPIVTVTAYDAPMASLADPHADVILVGDSVGMVMLGHASTVPVSLEAMTIFCAAAARGTRKALLIGDLPFGSYATEDIARMSAVRMVQEGGANAVKLEGGRSQKEKIQAICNEGIPVMAHVGLLPQTSPLSSGGSYVVQGKSSYSALSCVYDAIAAQDAGAFAVVLEVVPAQVSAFITGLLTIPTIGIGAGPSCGGQVLVAHDLLGFSQGAAAQNDNEKREISDAPSNSASGSPMYGSGGNSSTVMRQPRFVRRYASIGSDINLAFRDFAQDVRGRTFPASSSSSSSSSASTSLFTSRNHETDSIMGYDNSNKSVSQRVVQKNEFFDMDLKELRDFQVLAHRDFPSASAAHRALDAAAIELEKRLGGNMLGFQPSSSSSSFKSSPRIEEEEEDKRTIVQTKIRHDHQSASYVSGTLPSSSLSVAVLGSGAIASLISAALGTNERIKRLSMFSSWSERLVDIRKHGGIRFRRPLLHNSNIETVCSSIELYDLSDLSRSSIGANANALEDIVLSSSSSSSTHVITPSHGVSRNDIDSSVTGNFDLVLLCGKAYQVESQAALAALLVKPKAGLAVPLYNGADSFEYLSAVFSLLQSRSMDISPGQILYGQTSLGARYKRDEKGWILEHTGSGQTLVFDSSSDIGGQKSTLSCNNNNNNNIKKISCYNQKSDLILSAMQIGPGDGLGAWPLQVLFKPQREMELARWRKVAVNSVLNPICALLGVTNGGFGEAAQGLYKKQVNALAVEAARAIEVNCEGSSVTSHEIIDLVHTVSKKTSFNTNSLLADLKAGREIEAPFINGAIVRSLFDKKREPAPANSAVLSALEARTVALFGEDYASKASSRALRIISNRRQTL